MKILSLYDGISCGRVALERAGVAVERYVAYENNRFAIRASHPPLPFRRFNPASQQLTLF